uniref:odorant receptor Or1-like n=1 Tax=Osmia lignaria TaxID=473952 RepID=UPI0014793AEB|nr:odorant receptor Or1-like [Osmia lignaria]
MHFEDRRMDEVAERRTKIRPNKHLENSLSIIYYMGMWPSQSRYKRLYMLYTVFSFTFLLGIFLASEIAYIIVNRRSMDKIVAGATLLMTNITHAYKVIIIICRHNRIKDLTDITRSKIFSQDNDKYEEIVTHYTWQGIFHHIAYQSFGLMAVISWGVTPVLNILTQRSKELAMEGWYPYNTTSTPAFEITSSYQAVAIFLCCINNVAIDTLITGLITVACCQLAILSSNISSMYCVENTKSFVKNDNIDLTISAPKTCNKLYKDLKLSVEHSNVIFDFSKQIQNIFGTVIFLQFLVNCIIICLIAFNIAQMNDYIPYVLCGMLMYMCCMTYQIFIYCWHGNELYLHSMNVTLSAYSNNWWDNSKDFKQAICIIMVRVQQPLILTAGNIMELSLQTFVRILRMSYSIFTVLQSSTNN